MPNSVGIINPFFGIGGTVKAWGLFGFDATTNTANMTSPNFVNGYNLTFDDSAFSTQITTNTTSQQGISTGALPVKFVTPMANDRYKIFVFPRNVTSGAYSNRMVFAHALNTSKYRKTKTGFWVRFGLMINDGDSSFTSLITNRPISGEILNRSIASGLYQIQVVVV